MKNDFSLKRNSSTRGIRRSLFLMMCAMLCSISILAQERTISGTIADDDGVALVGVSVVVKGTTSGAITDVAGQFNLKVDPGAVLTVSYVGFSSQEITVGN